MLRTLQKIFFFLSLDDQKKFYGLIIAIVVMSLFDMVGVASIFPFLNVMSNPEIIQTNSTLQWLYHTFGFISQQHFLIMLGTVSFCTFLISNIIRTVTMKGLIRFTWTKHYSISKRLLTEYLYEPYAFFLNRNSSELTTFLMCEVARVVSGVLIPAMQILARILLTIFICALLFAVDPLGVILVLGVIGGGYIGIYLFFRDSLSSTGQERQEYNKAMYKSLNESFGGIKAIKLLGKEQMFIEQYADPAKKVINCYCSQFLIAQLPRYAFETLALGGILIFMLYLVVIKNSYQQIIPLIGLYGLASYRLMPALQQIFQDTTSIRASRSALDTVFHDFNQSRDNTQDRAEPAEVLPFSRSIEFRNITFQYLKARKAVIENFNLLIQANTTIGFVGRTGAGKTTVVDILLGLLWPKKGEIVIDDVVLSQVNLRRWQKNLGYVAQFIYLRDDTVTRNIAFGVPDHRIDHKAVEAAAQLANIHQFIMNELPQGYETEVGERGIRLSGGQRQRIGIARALYRNPSVLVLDEATSALDGITEDAILEAIRNLAHKKTIIIIAHRLSTVKECNVIYFLEHGKIVGEGTYEHLIATNEQFRKMAKAYEKNGSPSPFWADVTE